MNTLSNGSDAGQPTNHSLHPIDRMSRMVGFVHVLRMGFEDAAKEHDKRFERYTILCDSVIEEIETAPHQLRNG